MAGGKKNGFSFAALDPVKKHDFLNLCGLPFISLFSLYCFITADKVACGHFITCFISYMVLDAIYILTHPNAVPR